MIAFIGQPSKGRDTVTTLKRDDLVKSAGVKCTWGDVLDKIDASIAYGFQGIPVHDRTDVSESA